MNNLIEVLRWDLIIYGECYYDKIKKERIPPTKIRYSKNKGYYVIEGLDKEININDVIEYKINGKT